MFKEVTIPEKIGIEIICKRCGRQWIYTGKSKFVCCCPSCKTTITLNRKIKNFLNASDKFAPSPAFRR